MFVSKSKKISSTEEIMNKAKNSPDPATYEPKKPMKRVIGSFESKEGRSGFLDEAAWKGYSSPPADYNMKSDCIKPKVHG